MIIFKTFIFTKQTTKAWQKILNMKNGYVFINTRVLNSTRVNSRLQIF